MYSNDFFFIHVVFSIGIGNIDNIEIKDKSRFVIENLVWSEISLLT